MFFGICAKGHALYLTLDDVLDRLENENLQVLVQREVVVQALQYSYIQRAKLLPTVNFQAQQTKTRNFFTALGGTPLTSTSRAFYGRVEGTLSLLDMRRYADFELARQGHKISELSYKAVIQEIMNQGALAYYLHLRNLNRVKVIDANIERDKLLLNLAEHQFKGGIATPLDVTRAEVRLASDEKERLQQLTLVRQSELLLVQLLGLEAHERIETSQGLPEPQKLSSKIYWSPEEAFKMRPDYLKVEMDFNQSKFDYEASYWDHLPKLSAFGNWGYASVDAFNGKEKEVWMMGLQLNIPVFEGFAIQSNSISKKAGMRAQKYTLRDFQNKIKTDFVLNQVDLLSRFEQIKVAVKQQSLAQKELDLAQARFERGLAGNQEVVDAQTNVAEAEDGLVDSLYQYYVSELEWARNMGDVRMVLDT
ncbi:MAG: hypothetical protein COZ46_02380 [Verrucomicrobia bacterium CG_4_10_14_3_um_filter_43_23]|nr:MAG: hypothetical protein AUJ82_06395 [Verrucomicrobia bacterium CG1_02_43_26]PIP58723.1 MAG: hypothetical protein COX01_07295 [Verrucomicrobia bacterium CG22_combo_CG10-13_8_21_14_all_43_17]PIX58737.1 MAG: hypothetical protein COZ46_02380 [Verrucomicrobia bacterium CG_4_10_14_3_um_filter_43_23]PIY62947.1 MAG: hypothetical protein COY94_00810 [Verrucomicrobia bacterium CG_4_10_14_0_8_um_filter_43_34]PJA43916.1 MAG: hypothetical protein CO175_05630 [Verrucomicrobia bacterium CG_4_9_14_3_um_fi